MTGIMTGNGPIVRVSATEPERALSETNTIPDGVAVVGSTGAQALEPLVAVTNEGRTAFHTRCSPERVAELCVRADSPEAAQSGEPDAVVEHDPETNRLPVPALPGLGAGERTVLGACGWRRPTSTADHEAAGGFEAPNPAAVLDAGESLRGRGWGDTCQDEHVAGTWESVRESDGDASVVVNGHGTASDTLVLASAPFEVLDGAAAVARTVDADRIVVYASADDEHAVETVREAAEAYPKPPADIDVVTGPAEYRAAEPTMAIEAIEGNHRLEARLRPPGPEEVGLHGRPTLVHTPRTLAHLAVALRRGEPPGTRVLSVTGDVAAPVTLELPETATLSEAVDAADVTGDFKAACVGGQFGGVVRDTDVALDPGTLADADLGTEGAVRVLADDRCVVEFVGHQARFASEENCGRCVPCREGSTQLVGLLQDIYGGEYDRDDIEELLRVMDTSSICAFGVQAGRPTRTAISAFEAEFEAHADGRCPAGSCTEALEAS